jgi:ferredoxin-NADP reductase
MQPQTNLLAGNLVGDFVLPKDKQKKLVFIAGGIGITPFRSILKYLLDTNQTRNIVLLYANKTVDEIVYLDVLEEASQKLGIRTILTLTDSTEVPKDWSGKTGRITMEMIQQEIPDYSQRYFYLSGPHAMVVSYEQILHQLSIDRHHITKDFFPGFV